MEKVYVPPIKIQGIKTKLVPIIRKYCTITEEDIWIEPFMGSGVVGFNMEPKKAIFSDANPHLICFYQAIKDHEITAEIAREYLEVEGAKLREGGEAYYREVRDRFNVSHQPLDFLFLNRSCFNGMIRFNKEHKFNVPYGHKPNRFAKAYITKIVNQIKHIQEIMEGKDWQFICQTYQQALQNIDAKKSFIYCDPPYIGRHVDYYDTWDIDMEKELKECLVKTGARFMLSTWDYNKYRKNECIQSIWGFCEKISKEHYYFVGGKETNRNPMVEALLVNYTIKK